jgi:hypothetical protein
MPIDPGLRRKLPLGLAVIAALLLGGATTVHFRVLNSTLEQNEQASLEREWSAMKGYLRLERGPQPSVVQAHWYYDDRDLDESAAVTGIRERVVIMDRTGQIIHEPPSLPEIRNQLAAALNSLDSPDDTVFRKVTHNNVTYMVRAGVLFDESRSSRYPAALVIRLNRNRSAFVMSLVGAVVGALLLGWSIARSMPHITR